MNAKTLNDTAKSQFYYELAIFFGSGMDLKNALLIIHEENKKFKHIYGNLYQSIMEGTTMAEAMQETQAFSEYEIYNIQIGEETGSLTPICEGLSEYFSRKQKVKNQLIGALSYPSFILALTLVVLIFMMNFVVPMFSDIFLRFDSELPEITQFILNSSDFFLENTTSIFIGFLGFVILISIITKSKKTKDTLAHLIIHIPIYGSIIKDIQINKYYQAMSLLLKSNVTLIESLALSKKIITFSPLVKIISDTEDDILKGITFHASIAKSGLIPSRDILLFKIAEELNQLETVFEKLTIQYTERVDNKTQIAGKLIEPVLIVFIGSIVGFILIAMYLPLFELSSSI